MAFVIYDSLKKIAPGAKVDLQKIGQALTDMGPIYGVNTEVRLEMFIAQAAHETAGFKTLEEYATGAAYEGRKDLGNTQPGDGVRFKGRGIFQITGRSNYKDVSKHIFGDERLLTNPELLTDPKYATQSALYYWDSRNLSTYADRGDFQGLTKRINGGLNGWADRLNYFEKIKIALTNSSVTTVAKEAQLVVSNNPTKVIIAGVLVFGLMTYYIYRIAKAK